MMSEVTDMDHNFYKYLRRIGIVEKNLQERISQIFLFYANYLCPETIQDIFVTDYMSEESREYENLWLFSKNYAMEAKRFISEDNFDISPITNIKRIEINKTKYDFIEANDSSRLNLYCDLESAFLQMRASKENCDYLKVIIDKYLKSRLKKIDE